MYQLIVKNHFDAAHYIEGYSGDCANVHGHTWKVEVVFNFVVKQFDGMCLDFRMLKEMIASFLPDHKFLNKYYNFNPTAENISDYLYNAILLQIKRQKLDTKFGASLESVTVWESENMGARRLRITR